MRFIARAVFVAALFACIRPDAGMAQAMMCGPRERIVEALEFRFGESQRAIGVAGGSIMELYASASGTWTVIVTGPQKLSCILAAGKSLEFLPQQPKRPTRVPPL